MACCIVGAFLLSHVALLWRWFGVAARGAGIAAAGCGVILLGVGSVELGATAPASLLVPLCSTAKEPQAIRLTLAASARPIQQQDTP